MKFLFVLRKTHERIVNDFKENNKLINDERIRVTDKNIELQKEVKELQKEVTQLKRALNTVEEIVNENDKTIDRLVKENKELEKERDNAIRIQRSETRTRKSRKYREMELTMKELQEDLDKTRKELDEALTKILQSKKECNCNHDENNEEVEIFVRDDSELTDKELADKLNEAMKTEFPELPFTDIEPPIKTVVQHGVIRPVKRQPKTKGKRVNKANKNSKMNNKRKGGK